MIKKLFGQMILTQILSSMTVTLCMLVDSVMIGRFLGVDCMTAYGLASPVLLVFAALGSMISAGIQVMCGKAMGSGNKRRANACYTISVIAAAAIAAVGTAAVLLYTDPICTLLGAGQPGPDNPVFALTRDYLRGFIIGAPAFIAAQIMVPYMQISGSRKRLVIAVIAMTVGDIAFDLLNVLAVKGGIFGMGLASSLSYYIAFMIGIPYFFKKSCIFKFRVSSLHKRDLLRLVKAGTPTLVNQISLVLLTFVLNKILIVTGGNLAVAAYSVIATAGNLCYAFSTGVASVSLTLASIFYGDEDRSALKSVMNLMIARGIVICGTVTLVVLAAATPLVSLFLEDAAAKGLAVQGMRLFVLSLVPCVLNTSFKNFYQAVERVGVSMTISVMQNFALTAISAYLLSLLLGVTGVWLGYLTGESLTLLLICVMVLIRSRKLRMTTDAFMLLNPDFGVSDEQCLELTVTDPEEVRLAVKNASGFCTARGLPPRLSTCISLCIEEMSENIVRHGFKEGADNSIDIRIMIRPENTVVRIRDNCRHFDPVKYMELHSGDDPTEHIGIRMVMGVTKEVSYVNSLGLNNLTMIL